MSTASKKHIGRKKITALIESNSGLHHLETCSTPAPGTEKSDKSGPKTPIYYDYLKLCQQTVANHPFKRARLVHYNFDLAKRWHVVFWAWNVTTERLERVRLFKPLNYKKYNVNRRLEIADEMICIVNAQLAAGMVLGKDKSIDANKSFALKNVPLNEALEYFAEQKKISHHRKSYYRSFTTLANNWIKYIEHKKIGNFPLRQLEANDVHDWFAYMQTHLGIANKTHNKYRSDLNIFIRHVLKRYPGTLKANPVDDVPVLQTITRKHAAFTDAQMKAITDHCLKKGYTQLWLFIQFIYYSLARPGELMQLRIRHIDLQENRLFIPGTISKNRMDEYVSLAPPLRQAIAGSGIMKADPDYYIFGKKQLPGPDMPYKATFWERNVKVLKELNLTDRSYDIYSYKHSGAISLYRLTKDIKLVQRQCRHQSIEQTNTYLRDLGILDDHQALAAWRGYQAG